jgi:hypothetical protein
MQIGQFLFERHMIVVRARDVSGAAGPRATVIDRFMHRLQDERMLAHAQIIVGAPHADLLGSLRRVMRGARKGSSLPPEVCEDSIATFSA